MKYIQLTLLLAIFLSFTNCNYNKKITATDDYNSYLTTIENKSLITTKNDLDFWESKLENTPNQYPYLAKIAAANTSIFKLTGDITSLKEAERKLITANEITKYNNVIATHSESRKKKRRTFHLEFTIKEHKMAVQASPALPVLPVVMTMVIKLQ